MSNDVNVGTTLGFRIGGDFWLSEKERQKKILFIAGGIGINPLLSMLLFLLNYDDYSPTNTLFMPSPSCPSPLLQPPSQPQPSLQKQPGSSPKYVLLYSSKTKEELVFYDQLVSAQKNCPQFDCKFFVTGDATTKRKNNNNRNNDNIDGNSSGVEKDEDNNVDKFETRRINEEDVKVVLDELMAEGGGRPEVYVCGPPLMTDFFVQFLSDSKFPDENVKFEKW
eukprot:CAMPEP_0174257156 /NCGR_PEP_ID=MMETSP0439-20130205/6315_1 /TAXON_ID=0 /ORGANISM="Stereomyxa ramosa, Strain Chinc5" /LENGTH=222 /DNA_ID=CAMNT_0015340101 /DNA_START=265 /DNA_END=930 /DNA_ORIENTATION=+